MFRFLYILLFVLFIQGCQNVKDPILKLNDLGYFEMPGLNVMAFSDFYPEGHQGGVSVILNGVRVAANGDIRLEPAPGQWQPIPKMLSREVDSVSNVITARLQYPDSSRHRKGFNPIVYPDGLYFTYSIRVKPAGSDFKIIVDMDQPVPAEWVGKIGFNFEIFPGEYFGKHYMMDDKTGLFPRQLGGPMSRDTEGSPRVFPLAEGSILTIAPDDPSRRMQITSSAGVLQLYDGREQHNNGWFVVRSPIPAGATKNALEWTVSASALKDFTGVPVVHTSQVGYHPSQEKMAVIELDKNDKKMGKALLMKIEADGSENLVLKSTPEEWGNFLRYRYLRFDFSKITAPGVYKVCYRDQESSAFQIKEEIYNQQVWQPTLEYFLPVQMCHMRVNDRYRVWHGLCHMDDALMAPTNHNHFDGYIQGPSTLTKYKPLGPVPGLNVGGWHDAGDYDLRVESQIGTVKILSDAYLEFKVDYDATFVDQKKKLVELHQPDGVPDILQQIEHGVLTILAGYNSLGRLYRGIICNDLRQYVLLGDGSTMTDNLVYDKSLEEGQKTAGRSGIMDDRWVFTEQNPARELQVAGGLARASTALKEYNRELSAECLRIATVIYESNKENNQQDRIRSAQIRAITELYLATGHLEYREELLKNQREIVEHFDQLAPAIGKVMHLLKDERFEEAMKASAKNYSSAVDAQAAETPFGVPYRPRIWGAGWEIQSFGVDQFYLYKGWPDIFGYEYMLNALNFVLGCHPGDHSKSFASGVGATSLEVAYGTNRAEWSYIPGGVGSGTALIRPDFPELKEWPYFWQQTEYVMGGGGSNFLFLVLAAEKVLGKN